MSCESINKASQKYTFALHDNQAFLDVVALVPPLALVVRGLIRFQHPHTITAPLISAILGSHRKNIAFCSRRIFFLYRLLRSQKCSQGTMKCTPEIRFPSMWMLNSKKWSLRSDLIEPSARPSANNAWKNI